MVKYDGKNEFRRFPLIPMKMQHIGIIGCGALGEALLTTLQKKSLGKIIVSARSASRLNNLKRRYNVEVTNDNLYLVQCSREIYLCVKPTQAESVCNELKDWLRSDTIVISAMAGVPVKSIVSWLNHANVLKIMPTITLDKNGPIAVTGHQSTQHNLPKESLIYMTEKSVDLSTAISGCMPEFLAYILKEWIDVAVDKGMERKLAERLVLQNFVSLAASQPRSIDDLDEIRRKVSSKGGATEQGVEALKKSGLKEGLDAMIAAADNRVKQISSIYE